MTSALVTDKEASSDPDVSISIPDDTHSSDYADTITAVIESEDIEVELERCGIDGKSTVIFRVSRAPDHITDSDLEGIAAAISDEILPFVAIER